MRSRHICKNPLQSALGYANARDQFRTNSLEIAYFTFRHDAQPAIDLHKRLQSVICCEITLFAEHQNRRLVHAYLASATTVVNHRTSQKWRRLTRKEDAARRQKPRRHARGFRAQRHAIHFKGLAGSFFLVG